MRIKLMRVLILGFSSLQEIDSVMEKLIAETGCFLFSVVCGSRYCTTYDWAISRGAPVIFCQHGQPLDLVREADYIVAKINDETPQWVKNLVMRFKAEGKHGTVVR